MLSIIEAKRIADEVQDTHSADPNNFNEEDFDIEGSIRQTIKQIEAAIDEKLTAAIKSGLRGVYIDVNDMGPDADTIIKMYQQEWEVEYMDKADSYLFQMPDDPSSDLDEGW